MKRNKDFDWNFWVFIVVSLLMISFFASRVHAKPRAVDPCLVMLDNRSVAKIVIAADGTVLDFPVKPTKVILGRRNSFGIEYVESDLAVSPLNAASRSRLYVYLEGRRFTFELTTVMFGGCAVIAVRDTKENQVSVDGLSRLRNERLFK